MDQTIVATYLCPIVRCLRLFLIVFEYSVSVYKLDFTQELVCPMCLITRVIEEISDEHVFEWLNRWLLTTVKMRGHR
jgi:hypothetical protein